MKQNWTIEELDEFWTLHPDEIALLANKSKENKLGFALIFKYFQITSFFPKEISDIPKAIIFHIAKQVNVATKIVQSYKWNKKSSEVYRRQIRDYLGFRKFRKEDIDKIKKWLLDFFFLDGNQSIPYLQDKIYKYLNENKIEPFSRDQSEKYIFSALNDFEKKLFEKIEKSLRSLDKINFTFVSDLA